MIAMKWLWVGVLSSSFLLAWQYPVKRVTVTSLFAESRVDHFHNGVDFSGLQLVYPIHEGEVIFYREDDPLTDFMGVGNHMVVEHRNGIRSFYYHLADESLNKTLTSVTKEDFLATMGNTGKSFGNHLHLTVFDSKTRQVLNPQLLLPEQPDKIKPVISSLYFTIKETPNIYKIKNRSVINYKNNIKLYISAGDIKPRFLSRNLNPVNARGLRRLTFKIDDQIHRNYEFEYLLPQGEKLVLKNGLDFFAIYGNPFNYLLGEFFPSKTLHRFHLEVEDWAGNLDVESYNVIFRL